MKRKGELQFEYLEHRGGTVHGFAVDYDKGDVVAQMSMVKPRAFIRPEDIHHEQHFEDPNGQLRMPIREQPSRVTWALATGAGRRAAAPHLLAAALSEHYGLRPVADETLTAEGARMSRSAARRGLITPHPNNPEMEATAGTMVGSESEARSSLLGAYEGASMGQWSKPRYNERGQRTSALDKFSPQQMGRAAQRVFGSKKRQRKREPEPEQGTLF